MQVLLKTLQNWVLNKNNKFSIVVDDTLCYLERLGDGGSRHPSSFDKGEFSFGLKKIQSVDLISAGPRPDRRTSPNKN